MQFHLINVSCLSLDFLMEINYYEGHSGRAKIVEKGSKMKK